MGVSFRPALTFPHTPARPPSPESSREPNLGTPPPLFAAPRHRQAPSAVHRATPASRTPAEAQSECFVIIPPCTPPSNPLRESVRWREKERESEQPPRPPSTLCLHPPPPPSSSPSAQGAAADTLATTYTPRISALGIPSAPRARVRARFVVGVKRASFQRAREQRTYTQRTLVCVGAQMCLRVTTQKKVGAKHASERKCELLTLSRSQADSRNSSLFLFFTFLFQFPSC